MVHQPWRAGYPRASGDAGSSAPRSQSRRAWEPAWHRRARRERQHARILVALGSAARLLEAHHSAPLRRADRRARWTHDEWGDRQNHTAPEEAATRVVALVPAGGGLGEAHAQAEGGGDDQAVPAAQSSTEREEGEPRVDEAHHSAPRLQALLAASLEKAEQLQQALLESRHLLFEQGQATRRLVQRLSAQLGAPHEVVQRLPEVEQLAAVHQQESGDDERVAMHGSLSLEGRIAQSTAKIEAITVRRRAALGVIMKLEDLLVMVEDNRAREAIENLVSTARENGAQVTHELLVAQKELKDLQLLQDEAPGGAGAASSGALQVLRSVHL